MPAAPDNTASDSVATEPLGDVMSRVARKLQEEHGDVEATLRAVTSSATTTVPNAEACGISYVTGRSKSSRGPGPATYRKTSTPCRNDSSRGRASTPSGTSPATTSDSDWR